MREAVWRDIAATLALKSVVADGGGGVQSFLDVALFQDIAGLVGALRPEAGEAVGLEFQTDR